MFSLRLKDLRKSLNINQKDFCERLGLTQSNLSRYESGKQEPSLAVITKIVCEFNINSNWLIKGEGNIFSDNKDKTVSVGALLDEELNALNLEPRIQKIESQLTELMQLSRELSPPVLSEYPQEPSSAQERKVPYFGKVAAGNPIAIQSHPDKMISVPARLLKNSGEYYVVKASGQSMTDAGISSGSLCLIKKTSEKREGVILLVRYENESTLKRYSKNYKTGEDRLCYENGSGHCITPAPGSWEVQGELVTVL